VSTSRWNTKAAKEALRLIRQGQRYERESLWFEVLKVEREARKNQRYNAAFDRLTDVFGESLNLSEEVVRKRIERARDHLDVIWDNQNG
jgi:hypothetical protein